MTNASQTYLEITYMRYAYALLRSILVATNGLSANHNSIL